MRKGEIAFYLAAVAVSAAAFLYAGRFPSDAAYFPRMISALIILLCAVLMLRSFRRTGQAARKTAGQDGGGHAPAATEEGAAPMLKAAAMAAMLLLYCLAFPYTGYLIPTVLLTGGTVCLYGGRRWAVTALLAVLVPTALYLIFRFLLLVNFPSDGLFF